MPQLKSMKLSKKDQKEIEAVEYEPPEYPYGLSIHLDNESVKKVGASSLKVGDEVMIVAKATVKSMSSHESEKRAKDTSVDLQITEMAVDAEKSTADKAAKMFGGDDLEGKGK